MRRGTRVGQAYVAITADGDTINKDIVDSVDSADTGEAGERAGGRAGDGFSEGFSEKMDALADRIADRLGAKLGKSLSGSLTRSFNKTGADSLGDRIGKTIGESMSDGIENAFAQVLDRMEERSKELAREMTRSTSSSGSGSSSTKNTGNSAANKLGKDDQSYYFNMLFEASRLKLARETNSAIVKDNQRLIESQQKILDSSRAAEKIKTQFLAKFENARVQMIERSNEIILKDDADLVKRQAKLFDSLQKSAIKADAEMWRVRRTTADAYIKYRAALERGVVDEFGNAQKKVSGNGDGLLGLFDGNKIGSLLGKGSRNNGLNLLGSTVGNLINLTQGLGKVAMTTFSTFAQGAASAGQAAGLLARVSAGGGAVAARAFAALAASGPAAAVAIGVIIVAASVLATVLSAVLALVTALASTIVSALVGAGALLVGTLGAVAVAGGLVAVAFTSMTNAQQDDLAAKFRPLKAELTGIGQLMITQIVPYFSSWSSNLQRALYQLAPLATVFGQAIGQAGNSLTASLSGPGFQMLTQQLAVYLPTIVTRLSSAFGSFINGVAGIFSALLPTINTFAAYLARSANAFSVFVNSARGQNAIKDFIDRAVASLKSLWGFLRQVGGLIADVLFSPKTQGAGNGIFDSLADSVRKLRGAISDGKLEEWMQEGIEFGRGLRSVLSALVSIFKALNNSGVLKLVTTGMRLFALQMKLAERVVKPLVAAVGLIGDAVGSMVGPVESAIGALGDLAGMIERVSGLSLPSWAGGGGSDGSLPSRPGGLTGKDALGNLLGVSGTGGTVSPPKGLNAVGLITGGVGNNISDRTPSLDNIIASGTKALNETYESDGGYLPDPETTSAKIPKVKEFVNPYLKLAEQIIAQAPTAAQRLREALKELQDQAIDAIRSAVTAGSASEVESLLTGQMEALRDAGKDQVSSARDNLTSAAESLKSASNRAEAETARLNVKNAKAELKTARNNRKALNEGAATLKAQQVVNSVNVAQLVEGFAVQNATLADYAAAREQLSVRIDAANAKLAEAISVRDNYNAQITAATKAFGSLMNAQAQVINGVTAALTATDIVSTLEDRLERIRSFRTNLRSLLALGLSNDAYQQLVDAGVEQGAGYAQAILDGGAGAVGAVNNLVGQIDAESGALGSESATRLYQAGVNAAQGLVDGLNSQAAALDAAAARLGTSIAQAVKNALGISSPSKVLDMLMDPVGDGMVKGLNRQNNKVDKASTLLSSRVAISPTLAAAQSEGRVPSAVSGNTGGNQPDPRFRDLIIHTPTKDPKAVGREVLNEVVGDL